MTLEEENLKAFEKLLKQAEIEKQGRLGSYHYYRDQYDGRYGWYVSRQKDGKFHAFINTKRKHKVRTFTKKRKAIEWAYNNWRKRNDRQKAAKKIRAITREAAKPVLTGTQRYLITCEKAITHNQALLKRNQAKIKSLMTRSKTYQRRIKYYQKKKNMLAEPQPLTA